MHDLYSLHSIHNQSPCPLIPLSNHSRLLPAQELLQLANLKRNLDQALQALSSGRCQLLTLVLADIPLDIQTHSRALTARTAQTEDDTAAVRELDDLALVLRHAAVDGVGVVEVDGLADGEGLAGGRGLVRGVDESALGDVLVEVVDELVCALGRYLLVVVAREEGATILGVVLLEELVDADELIGGLLVGVGDDVQPR